MVTLNVKVISSKVILEPYVRIFSRDMSISFLNGSNFGFLLGVISEPFLGVLINLVRALQCTFLKGSHQGTNEGLCIIFNLLQWTIFLLSQPYMRLSDL